MKRKLKIAIFDPRRERLLWTHHIFQLLAREYDVELSDAPELLFFSQRQDDIRKAAAYRCHKVFFTGENVKPDFRICDYAFSFEDTDRRNFQFPSFARFPYFRALNPCENQNSFLEMYVVSFSFNEFKEHREAERRRFCCFLYSNYGPKQRVEFCKKLMLYKKVDCPGKVLNNMFLNTISSNKKAHLTSRERLAFHNQYKFSIAFENQSAVNYTTEKICIPFAVGSIPIYWGNPRVAEFFNPEAFINCHDYDGFDQVIKRVIEVDNNDDLYRKYVNAPAILETSKLCAATEENIIERLDKIVNSIGVTTPVSSKYPFRFWSLKSSLSSRAQTLRSNVGLQLTKLARRTTMTL